MIFSETPLAGAYTIDISPIHESRGFFAKAWSFKNYYETLAFVNAVAWIVHGEDHHPDLSVGYNRCRVEFSTHSIGGISENDFICAAKIEALAAI